MNLKQGILFNKKKEKIKKEGFELMDMMNTYSDDTDELVKDYSEAINRTNQENPLKNSNIKIELEPSDSEPITEFGYVNNVGVLRPYMDNVDYRSTTWGKNGCPTNLSTKNISKTKVKLNKNNLFEIETEPKLINIMFPMIPGQACGFEGENIYVDSIGNLKDYTTEFKGIYNTNLPNVDNNSKLFNYELCKTRAIDQGMRYFGVNNYDKNLTNSNCVVSNNISEFYKSILSGNIIYNSSSVPLLHDGISTVNQLKITVMATELRLYKLINNEWILTQILATYNTDANNECYNNGTFNINEVQATWGAGMCNNDRCEPYTCGFNNQPNNMADVLDNLYKHKFGNEGNNVADYLQYQIATNGIDRNLDDIAPGCPKPFSISYKCGNIPKSDNREGESGGQYVDLNCTDEYKKCQSVLVITDDGFIYICKKSDVTITNNNFASLNDNATIFYTWNFSDKIDKSNDSISYRQNFIDSTEYINFGDCICSPNKKIAMTCNASTELVIITYTDNSVKIDDIQYGLENSSAVYEITNLPPSNNVGKIAWLNAIGLRKEYPPELLEKSDEYDMFPGWTSAGNDIFISEMTPNDGKNWCNNNYQCAGFQYSNGICYFKNDQMYPKGKREPDLGGSQIYIRKNKIRQLDSVYDYEMIPDFDSPGYDFYAEKMPLHDAKKYCDNNSECAGFEYYTPDNMAYFKNDEMYPKGASRTLLGGQLYIKKDYKVIHDFDSPGYDIYAERMSLHDAKKWCDNNPECAGFTYYTPDNMAYFKNDQMYPKGVSRTLLGAELYIKINKADRSKSTCSTKVNNIDNLTWDHYIPDILDGIYMTETYNCSNKLLNPNIGDYTNLNNNKDRLKNELNDLDNSMFEQTSNLVNETASLNKENNLLYNSMKENFTPSINQLNDVTYLNTLLSNSKKFVISQSYIIITLLVVLLGLIIVLYKMKK